MNLYTRIHCKHAITCLSMMDCGNVQKHELMSGDIFNAYVRMPQYLFTAKYPSAISVQLILGIINSLNSYRIIITDPHFVVSTEDFFLFGVFVDLRGVRGVNMGVELGAMVFFLCVATTFDGCVLSLVGILHARVKKVI